MTRPTAADGLQTLAWWGEVTTIMDVRVVVSARQLRSYQPRLTDSIGPVTAGSRR